ncbi:DoxX family protein [Brevibacillus panacihumi]|uniref:DoxX family protein n=1 Tax=Brevibacillus panacihumi TaxID=497735 RepID=A0A3M8CCB7_9BACL|nr:DoxX family protein [Brevibacillus panacihumi]RNB73141.1 DoxX family protein [Brevibacillus panacihumi]
MNQRFEWSLLLIRVVAGVTFLVHGIVKFQMGLDNVAGFFGSLSLPAFLAYLVTFLETIGGLALILGFGTRVFSALLGIVMIGAIFTAKLAGGFLGDGTGAGYELDLALLSMLLALVISGSSRYSVDSMFSNRKAS